MEAITEGGKCYLSALFFLWRVARVARVAKVAREACLARVAKVASLARVVRVGLNRSFQRNFWHNLEKQA